MSVSEGMNGMTQTVKRRKQTWLRILLCIVLLFLTIYLSALIVLTIEVVNNGRDWMFESKACAISAAFAEPVQSPDLSIFSSEAATLPLQKDAQIINMNYSSHKKWTPMFWFGCKLQIH